jgi:hypothetical protein
VNDLRRMDLQRGCAAKQHRWPGAGLRWNEEAVQRFSIDS